MNTAQFFISYRNVEPDVKWAYWVAWQIELKYGEESCLIQEWDFSPNGNFIKNMHKGALCDFTIAIGSPNYFTSEYTADEWTAAFHERKLILLEIAPCQTLGLLSPLFRLRLYDFDSEQAKEALYKHVERVFEFKKQGRMKPATPPDFPNSHLDDSSFAQSPCNLPYPLSPHFVCPEHIWNRLIETAGPKATNITERSVFVLHGLHGIGKTSIACAFAWKHRSDFSAVLWIRGNSKEVLHASLGALCEFEALDLPEQKETNNVKRVEAVRRWLKGHTGWLLIVDNVDSEEARDFLFECVPAAFAGTLLATSCLSDWDSTCHAIEMLTWTHALGADFFIKRLQLAQSSWPSVARLSDALGGLPLALEQAAAYMRQTRISPDAYLTRLLDDIKQAVHIQTSGATKYSHSFVAIIKQSLAHLSSEARFTLELAAFLAPNHQMIKIYEVLTTHPRRSQMEANGVPVYLKNADQHVTELNLWSFIIRREDDFDVHPLVQLAVQELLSAQEQKQRISALLHMFIMPFLETASPSDSSTWNFWRYVFPHMDALLVHLQDHGDYHALGILLNSMGMFLTGQGLYEDAVTFLKNSVKCAELSRGVDHSDTAGALNNLADALTSWGKPSEAKPLLLRVIEITEKNDPQVKHAKSSCWNNLGSCLEALGDFDGAEEAFRKAMAYDVAREGSNDRYGLIVKNNLANLLNRKGANREAEELYRSVVQHMQDDVELACVMTNLGALLYETMRPQLAVQFLELALELLLHHFGPAHPHVKKTKRHLAFARKLVDRGGPAPEKV